MKMPLLTIALAAVAMVSAAPASADPLNANTRSFTATCDNGLSGTSVALQPALDHSAARAFLFLDTQQVVLLANTPGLERRAETEGTTCTVTHENGQPVEPYQALVILVSA